MTRRSLLGQAAVGLIAVAGAGSLSGIASASLSAQSTAEVIDFIVTQEHFGVTFLTEAVRRAPGTPSAAFLPVLKAANTTEFDHINGLKQLGAKPLVTKFWIPEAAFGKGGAGLFASIEAVETIELSMYTIGVNTYAQAKTALGARVCAEAMATESEHRVLARFAKGTIEKKTLVPNNISFAPYNLRTTDAVKAAAEKLGIGYGTQGTTPGKFYEYPGNPLSNHTGLPQTIRTPS